jgi:mono/diheme cytochrome c family protein
MRIFISIIAIALTAGIFVYSCGGSESNTKTESKGAETVAASGAQLYSDNCVICHGKDGKAGMSGATDLSTSVLSHESTVDVIANGRNAMRAFSNQFTKEEIEAIAKHVESLRK